MAADIRAYLAEFIGTFILVFTVGCNVLSKQSVWAGVSIACSLMVAIYALAPISGANFNPAVSVTLGITGNLAWQDVAAYSFVQISAGVLAGFLYHLLFGAGFALGPVGEFSWWQAGACELLYTFMLCFVVLNTACAKANAGKHQFYGLSIGFVIVAGAYGAGAVSGGCFNPAVALGIEAGSLSFGYSPLYILFELAGAALAAALFKVVRPEAFDNGEPAALPAKVTSEILGTYMLVLTVGLNVLTDSPAAALSIAASLACMIFALGDLSEAHFNPAVTMAVYAIQKIDVRTGLIYGIAQFSGAAVAGLTYVAICGNDFALGAAAGWSWTGVAAAETAFTFLLCFVMLSVTMSSKHRLSELYGLAIALCVVAGGFAAGGVSGGSLNPAVSFGVAVGDRGASAGQALLYAGFEFLSSVFAASAFMVTQGEFC
mmetsp:Transcript_36352/g.94927  ORF Transcript_36352/g.94927 Transcript_36352/m.94927 type:complete len:431 (+) Transcript_36352:73-1365(+)